MSNRRSRRLVPLKHNSAEASSDEAKIGLSVDSKGVSIKNPPDSLFVSQKSDTLEHYKVEDRIQSDTEVARGDGGETPALMFNETKQSEKAESDVGNRDDEGDQLGPSKPNNKSNISDEILCKPSHKATQEKAASQKDIQTVDDKNNDEAITAVDTITAATHSTRRLPSRKAASVARETNEKEGAAAPLLEAKENGDTLVAENLAIDTIQRPRTRSASSAAKSSKLVPPPKVIAKQHEEPAKEAAPESDIVRPTQRHRTRSTSSAVSSISGDSNGPDSTNYFDNDGKTPLIANRRSKRSNGVQSHGPVRKRHKGRALFDGNLALPNNTSIGSSLFQEGLLNNESEDNILATLPRSRSNTIDSFRAAMDSTLNIEISKSVVLPEISTDAPQLNSKTIVMSKFDVSSSPRGRSDTIDFLTAAVEGDIDANELAAPPSSAKISDNSANEQNKMTRETIKKNKSDIAFGKTPKKTNLSGDQTNKNDPLKKRYRTRSLSFDPNYANQSTDKPETKHNEEVDEDDIATASIGGPRSRSNTLESFQNTLNLSRTRSDTMDFLTAAVAGDMGHDLDAAIAAATSDGSSFAMHPISAPSGASISHLSNSLNQSTRSRSNTLDSTASSVNSSKLDFLISVAAEEGAVFGLLPEERIRDRAGSTSENSSEQVQRRSRSNTLEMYSNMAIGRGRSDTIDFLLGSGSDQPVGNLDDGPHPEDNTASGNVLDHLKALCDDPAVSSGGKTTGILRRGRLSHGVGEASSANILNSSKTKFDEESTKKKRSNSDYTNPSNSAGSSSQRMVMEALQQFEDDKRDRNDSWGGMSDLSVTGIAATHDALKSTGIIDDLMAAAADIADDSEQPEQEDRRKRTGSGGSTSLSGKGRPRLNSLASLSLASLSDASISVSGRKEQYASELIQKLPTSSSKTSTSGSQSIVVDYDAITAAVNAANAATEGLDLNLILSPTSKTSTTASKSNKAKSLASGKTASKNGSKRSTPKASKLHHLTAKSMSTKNKTPLSKLPTRPTPKPLKPFPTKYSVIPKVLMKTPPPQTSTPAKSTAKKPLPLRGLPPTQLPPDVSKPKPPVPLSIDIPIPKSTKTEAEMEAIRQRARAAAGYVPPGPGSIPTTSPALKTGMSYKMPPRKPPGPYPPMMQPPIGHSNVSFQKRPSGPHPSFVPSMVPPPGYMSRHSSSRASSLQSQQKWDDMFEYLVKFIEETRMEQTKNLSEQEKESWVWDGNVPTNYKTQCGKALGRWINNQRTSKTKGTLKDDREVRLVSTGLKWSVLTTNSWNEMLRELEIYAEQKKQGGKAWDGNVPTNYKITVERTLNGRTIEEEKNLGRWVNRQRSLYQAGKLKEDRQADLERVGLKWSVLMVASWSHMYECLCKYAQERRAENSGVWDGNVPASCRVESKPPVNLGRWVNRQRCAYSKGRLRPEFVVKLERTGLKWSVNDQKRLGEFDDDDFEGEEFIPRTESRGRIAPERVLSISPSSNDVARSVAYTTTASKNMPPSSVVTTGTVKSTAVKTASSAVNSFTEI